MGHYRGPIYSSASEITGPSGWYRIKTSVGPATVYVDQDYDGGGWILALANRGYTAGMSNLTYQDALTKCNYRINGTNNGTNDTQAPGRSLTTKTLADVNVWLGLNYWFPLANRVTDGYTTIVQFVSTTHGTALGATANHTKRYRWRFSSWNSEYAFVGTQSVSDETGTGAPGFYGYHAQSTARGLTTFDVDNDENGGNCATYYNNNPFWYGSCWSGNYFGGGGYQDRPYWNSSGGDNHNYGAVYIK